MLSLICRKRKGKQLSYCDNLAISYFQELSSFVIKTAGLGDVLRFALEPLAFEIRVVFVCGSVAVRRDRSSNDVDILVS